MKYYLGSEKITETRAKEIHKQKFNSTLSLTRTGSINGKKIKQKATKIIFKIDKENNIVAKIIEWEVE
jgi:hypothetical protein